MKIYLSIFFCRTATARGKAEQADESADQAKEDCDIAQMTAKQFAPDFKHPGFDRIGLRDKYRQKPYNPQVATPVSQESDKILDGKSIPNHTPSMHPQIPQANKAPYGVPPRRLSTQIPNKPVPPLDPRMANNTNYNNDDRTASPYYNSNQDHWSNSVSQGADYQKPYSQNDQIGAYGPGAPSAPAGPPSSYRFNRQDAIQHQTGMDPSSQQFTNQGRRISSATRPTLNLNQRPNPQEWNSSQGQGGLRRSSVLGQPTNEPQDSMYVDGAASGYGRNELRTGTVHSEGPLDRPAMDQQQYHQNLDSQGYRQQLDQQGYRQPADQQMYRQGTAEQQMYRQGPSVDQDMVNGPREARQASGRTSIDYFDHYKRPPSRDSSVDRYGRRSRQPSVEATVPPRDSRGGSVAPQPPAPASRPASRAATPAAGNGHLATGRGSISHAGSRETPFEESLMRKRTLGQDISPSPYQPKRTESLCMPQVPAAPPPAARGGGGGGGGGGRKVRKYLLKLNKLSPYSH